MVPRWQRLLGIVVLAVGVAACTLAVVGVGTPEARFLNDVNAHASSAAAGQTRADLLELAEGAICTYRPISHVDVRNTRAFWDFGSLDGLSAKQRANVTLVVAVIDAAVRHLCPITKELPVHPRADVLASFPLPQGTLIDSDPTLDRPDDDYYLIDEGTDVHFREAEYLPPQSLGLDGLDRFYEREVTVGAPWKQWEWCTTYANEVSLDGSGTDSGGRTLVWQRDDLQLSLSWSAVVDDLGIHEPGTVLIHVFEYDAGEYRDLETCDDDEVANGPGERSRSR